ncbi:MAG: carboxymethylenebutenolidase [Thiotrichales bacterium]|nr:carboxymethylenebutenolidase [Thiotrichales bacterium]
MGDTIEFSCPNGSTANGYRACAAGNGIVLLQEWWGVNEQMKAVARRCAQAGFDTLVPDLYHGRVTQDPDEAGHMMDGLDWVGATEQEVCGAVNLLSRRCARIAVMGYCMGGALSIIAGVLLPKVDAVICYYGVPPLEQADPGKLQVPFQGHFANRDDWCTPQAVDLLEQSLANVGSDVELHRYEAAHGFFNDSEADVYDRDASELSWQRVSDFLAHHLST